MAARLNPHATRRRWAEPMFAMSGAVGRRARTRSSCRRVATGSGSSSISRHVLWCHRALPSRAVHPIARRLWRLSRFARRNRYYTELLQLYKAIGIPFYLSSGDGESAERSVCGPTQAAQPQRPTPATLATADGFLAAAAARVQAASKICAARRTQRRALRSSRTSASGTSACGGSRCRTCWWLRGRPRR